MIAVLDSRQRFEKLAALVVCAGLLSGGCSSLRIHRPQDLANAQQAQAQFQSAQLAQTVAAERTRLAKILDQELELVRQNTLARRDARLLYVIGEGDSPETWAFLKKDLAGRLEQLGISNTSELKDVLSQKARAEKRKQFLATSAQEWKSVRELDDSLPALSCPQVPPAEVAEDNPFFSLFEDYRTACDKYLAVTKESPMGGGGVSLDQPLANAGVIAAMKAAKDAAQTETNDARAALSAAMSQASGTGTAPVGTGTVRASVKAAADRLLALGSKLESLTDKDTSASTALGDLGLPSLAEKIGTAQSSLNKLGLGAVVGDLGAIPAVARLEENRSKLMAGLSSTLQGGTATKVFASLQEIGVGLESPPEAPLTGMVIKQKQLSLDIEEANKKVAFFDNVLALLEEQESAYRDELGFLGQAELLRQELEQMNCLPVAADPSTASTATPASAATPQPPKFLEHLFTDQDPKKVQCRERVFRMLVEYSAAWTLGRVKSEQIDYRIIALHHDSALDTSEIAFRKWDSLLGLPIDQLVSLYQTGIKPADILSFFQALGVGAVAVGVN